jgi:16S rRNA G966 N2-methylase RsmD
MGLEALSRGADKLLLCDQSPLALAAMESNLKKIPSALTDKVKIIKATFPKSYGRLIKEGPFSLILLDPPYADPIENVINFLAWATKNKLASSDATVVWEQAPQSLKLWDPQSLVGWETVLTRRWGKRAVAILELNNEPNDSKTQNNEMIRVDQA